MGSSTRKQTATFNSMRYDENSTRFRFRPDSVERVDSDDVGPATCGQVKLSAGASLVDDRYDCCLGVIVAPGLKMRLLDINGGVEWIMRWGGGRVQWKEFQRLIAFSHGSILALRGSAVCHVSLSRSDSFSPHLG